MQREAQIRQPDRIPERRRQHVGRQWFRARRMERTQARPLQARHVGKVRERHRGVEAGDPVAEAAAVLRHHW
ncbi:hypothetical protein D3C72_2132350 [compost metagenome]